MLVIDRKVFERIWVGPDICVTVTRAANGAAKVAIHAPRELNIVREELLPDADPRKGRVLSR